MSIAADLLTLSRLPLAVAFWAAVTRPVWAFAILATAAATDVADGWVARRARRGLPPAPSSTGAWLDPVCDKLFVVTALLAIYLQLAPPLWMLVAIAARELALAPLMTVYRLVPALHARVQLAMRADRFGKAATVLQFVAVAALLLDLRVAPVAAIAAGAVGLVAVGHYAARGLRRPSHPAAVVTGYPHRSSDR